MKKIVKSIMATLCAVMLLGSLTACQAESAYDLAVKNGFKGTETEWLESLHGSDGQNGRDGKDVTAKDLYETAQENGFTGSFLDFCQNVLQIEVKTDNDLNQIAQNITSVVSIYCGFSRTIYYGGLGGLGGIIGGMPTKEYYASAGSGVVLELDKEKGDALIVTNYHVIYDAKSEQENGISESIYLYPYGAYNAFSLQTTGGYADTYGDGILATYVGGAMNYDIAVLKIENSDYIKEYPISQVDLGDSDSVRVGEKVYAIGNPDAAGIAVTEGAISVESEYITMRSTDGSNRTVDYRVMRTDAAINSGNSGGALFNIQGELIGVVNAKNVSTGVDNVGYALPSTQVMNLVDNICDNKKIFEESGNGAYVADLGAVVTTTHSNAYFDEDGALRIYEELSVSKLVNSGAAYKMLAVGDVIKGIQVRNGEWVTFTRQYQLLDQLLIVRKGDKVKLKILRDGTEKVIEVLFDKDSHFTQYS